MDDAAAFEFDVYACMIHLFDTFRLLPEGI